MFGCTCRNEQGNLLLPTWRYFIEIRKWLVLRSRRLAQAVPSVSVLTGLFPCAVVSDRMCCY